MHWAEDMRDGAIIAAPQGRVDEATARAFTDGLAASLDRAADTPSKKCVLDLAGIDYMSSRGLRALTLAKRKGDASSVTIILAAPNETMREILAISRYDKLFTIVETTTNAL